MLLVPLVYNSSKVVLWVLIGNYAIGTIGNSSKVVLLVVIGNYAVGTIGNSSNICSFIW